MRFGLPALYDAWLPFGVMNMHCSFTGLTQNRAANTSEGHTMWRSLKVLTVGKGIKSHMDQSKPTLVPITQEEAWRRDFEKMGAESLRRQIVEGEVTMSREYLHCAHAWILEKEEAEKFATERARFGKALGWTIVGAFAAMSAAAALVVALFRYT